MMIRRRTILVISSFISLHTLLYSSAESTSNERSRQQPFARGHFPVSNSQNDRPNFKFEKVEPPVTAASLSGIPFKVKEFIDMLKHEDKYRAISFPPGLLMYGPSGNGKSTYAKLIATETGRPLAHVYSSDFITKWQGSATKAMNELFESADQLGEPCIIFLDEVDGIVKNGMRDSGEEAARATFALIKRLNIYKDSKRNKVVVLLATNAFEDIPATIKDRYSGYSFEVSMPDLAQRRALIEQLCRDKKINQPDLHQIGQETSGLSRRMIERMIDEAKRLAIRRSLAIKNDSAVTLQDILCAIVLVKDGPVESTAQISLLLDNYLGKERKIDRKFLVSLLRETKWKPLQIETFSELLLQMDQDFRRGSGIGSGQDIPISADTIARAAALAQLDEKPSPLIKGKFLSYLLAPFAICSQDQQYLLIELAESTAGQMEGIVRAAVNVARDSTRPSFLESDDDDEIIDESPVLLNHLLAAAALIHKDTPLSKPKRKALLRYCLCKLYADVDISALLGLTEGCVTKDMEDLVREAHEIASQGEPGDKRITQEMLQLAFYKIKNCPITERDNRLKCIRYLNGRINKQANATQRGDCTRIVDVLVRYTIGFTWQQLEKIFTDAQAYALQRQQPFSDNHLIVGLYMNNLTVRSDNSMRKLLWTYFLESERPNVPNSPAFVQILIDGTNEFSFEQIQSIFDRAVSSCRESNLEAISDTDLLESFFEERALLEKPVRTTYRTDNLIALQNNSEMEAHSRTIDDQMPHGIIYWPQQNEIKALLMFHLKKSGVAHTVSVEYIERISSHCLGRISAFGVSQMVASAKQIAIQDSAADSSKPISISEGHILKVAFNRFKFLIPDQRCKKEWVPWLVLNINEVLHHSKK